MNVASKRKVLRCCVPTLLVILILGTELRAGDGLLDPSFGTDGKAVVGFQGSQSDYAFDLAIQPDGKLVAVGWTRDHWHYRIGVSRSNTDGTADNSFGQKGTAWLDLDGNDNIPSAVALQSDGKIIVAGYTISTASYRFVLLRLLTDGSLDPDFGGNGFVFTDFGGEGGRAGSVLVQADGKILVGGTAYENLGCQFALARYLSDGSLDFSFGTGGKVVTEFPGGVRAQVSAIAIQPDDRIVAAGTADDSYYYFAVARYTTNGSLDTSFGTNGRFLTDVDGQAKANGLVIQPDGKIVLVGQRQGSTPDFGLVRLTQDGTLDLTFSGDGKTWTDVTGEEDYGMQAALQTDGKILMVGYAYRTGEDSYDSLLVRYDPDGSLDSAFGVDGILVLDAGRFEYQHAVAVQDDGRVVMAGCLAFDSAGVEDFMLTRVLPDGTLDAMFGAGGKAFVDFKGPADDRPIDILLQADGKIVQFGRSTSAAGQWTAVLSRHNVDGSLDATFGNAGKVYLQHKVPAAAKLQTNGKIVVAMTGWSYDPDIVVVRLNADGTLDPAFGPGGIVVTDTGMANGVGVSEVLIRPNGQIILVGDVNITDEVMLVQYNPDGSLDTAFGSSGIVLTNLGEAQALCAALQSDGKTVVAGAAMNADRDFFVARFASDGSVDMAFGSGGVVMTDIAGGLDDVIYSVLVQPDGKILSAGEGAGGAFALARYEGDGTPDTGFGSSGLVITDTGTSGNRFYDVKLSPDGRIVAAGMLGGHLSALARYSPDGWLDPSFGSAGLVLIDLCDSPYYESFYPVAVQPDGRILAAGYSQQLEDIVLARFQSCLFCDDFEDSVLSAGWTYAKPSWSEFGGNLVGTPTRRKAVAIASPVFAGCSLCTVEADVSMSTGASSKVSLLAWYRDKENTVEVILKPEAGKISIKQRSGGVIVARRSFSQSILPDTVYNLRLTFDGTDIRTYVNDMPGPLLRSVGLPVGTVGFSAKNCIGAFGKIVVD